MAQRTQMRLHAITGSLKAIDTVSPHIADVSSADVVGANHLLDILGEFAGAIKRVHGAGSFMNQQPGVFTHSTASFSGELDIAGALDVNGAADIQGAMNLQSTLTVAGLADFNGGVQVDSIKIDGDVAQRLYIVDADGSMKDEAKLTFNGTKLLVSAQLEVSGAADLARVAPRPARIDLPPTSNCRAWKAATHSSRVRVAKTASIRAITSALRPSCS